MNATLAFLLATLIAPVTVRSGNFVVHSWTGNDRLARTILETATSARFATLPANAPDFGQPIHIYLAPDNRTFVELTGGQAPEWGAGVAAPEEGVIVLRAYTGEQGAYTELPAVLRHELAHIALYRYLQPARVPRWFDEGYAEWNAGELDAEGAWMLRVALARQHAPLDSLELSWPSMATDARVAYLLAASVVQYLVHQSGERGLTILLERWHTSHNFEAALASTYGLSIDQLEAHWRKDVKHRYGWLAVITQTGAAATIIAVGVIGLYVIRRRRDRKKLARLRETELPDEPAFWIEPPPETPQSEERHEN